MSSLAAADSRNDESNESKGSMKMVTAEELVFHKSRTDGYCGRDIVRCVLFALLFLLACRTEQKIFIFVSFLPVFCCIILSREEVRPVYLFFFVSWSNVLKLDVGEFSMFTFFVAMYILCSVWSLIKNRSAIKSRILFPFLLLAIYIVLASAIFQPSAGITILVSFVADLAVLFFVAMKPSSLGNYRSYALSYAVGLMAATAVSFMAPSIPRIEMYLHEIQYSYEAASFNRYSGLDVDPNYFSLQILMAMSFLLVLYVNDLKNAGLLAGILILAVLGLISVSKMYMITMILLIILTAAVLFGKKLSYGIVFLSFLAGFVVIALTLFPELFDNYLVRLQSDLTRKDKGIGEFTTGRYDLWLMYLEAFKEDMRLLLLGNGLNSGPLNGRGAHNIYLFTIYLNGLAGLSFMLYYFLSIFRSFRDWSGRKGSLLRFIPLLIFLFANFALDSLTFDYIIMQILLIIMAMNADLGPIYRGSVPKAEKETDWENPPASKPIPPLH